MLILGQNLYIWVSTSYSVISIYVEKVNTEYKFKKKVDVDVFGFFPKWHLAFNAI